MCRNMKGRVTQRKKRIQGVSQVKNWTGIWAAAKGARGNFVENNTLASDWLWWYRSLELLRFSQPACVAGKVGGTTGWRLLQWASGQPAAALLSNPTQRCEADLPLTQHHTPFLLCIWH